MEPVERTAALEAHMQHVLTALRSAADGLGEQNKKLEDLASAVRGIPELQEDVSQIRSEIDVLKNKATFIAGMAVAFGMVGSFLGITLATAKQWLVDLFAT